MEDWFAARSKGHESAPTRLVTYRRFDPVRLPRRYLPRTGRGNRLREQPLERNGSVLYTGVPEEQKNRQRGPILSAGHRWRFESIAKEDQPHLIPQTGHFLKRDG